MGRSMKGQQQRRWNWTMLCTAAAAALAVGGIFARTPAARAADDAKGAQFFEAKVRPILAEHCVSCHGPDKQKGDLRLDTRENLLKGGTDDNDKPLKVVEPGNVEGSVIIKAVEYKDEDLQMPPPKKKVPQKLTDEQINTLKEWVKMGVPYAGKPVEATKKG